MLSGARIVTMKGDEVIEKGDIVVTDNRIVGCRAEGQGRDSRRCEDRRCHRQDDHSRLRRRPRTYVAAARRASDAGLAVSGESGLRRDDDARPAERRPPTYTPTPIWSRRARYSARASLRPARAFSRASGLDDKDSVNNYIKRYRDAYKTDTLKQYVVGDRNVRQMVAMACTENKITPTTEGALDMKLDLRR